MEIVAQNLIIPWDIAFLPPAGEEMLVTERGGQLLRIGKDKKTYPIEGVRHVGEGGLLGITLHPLFTENHFVYLYLTSQNNGRLINRVERYRYEDNQLSNRTVIIDDIPGAQYHDGGRIAFGPDGFLYVTTGDAGQSALAQDTNSLAGKILRLNEDGSIPSDNPFGNAVWSYGHRNPQGISWDENLRLWSTEHGRSGVASGYDELNLIEKGGNYGWPAIQGAETRDGMIAPALHSGSSDTWAPASLVISMGRAIFGGLRGEALYVATIEDGQASDLRKLFKGEYGRIRTVRVGPDGYFYLTTSNRDDRGSVSSDDDKIIRIHPDAFL